MYKDFNHTERQIRANVATKLIKNIQEKQPSELVLTYNVIPADFCLQVEYQLNPSKDYKDISVKMQLLEMNKQTISQVSKYAGTDPQEICVKFHIDNNAVCLDEIDLSKNDGYFYYPASGTDSWPIRFLVQNSQISTFVYCDFAEHANPENLVDELTAAGFQLIGTSDLQPGILDENATDWSNYWHPLSLQHDLWGYPEDAFATLYTFNVSTNNEGRIVNLLFFRSEALGTFRLLCKKWGAPRVMNLQTEMGQIPVYYHTMRQIAIDSNCLPQLLLIDNGTEPWSGYIDYLNENHLILPVVMGDRDTKKLMIRS